MKKKPILIIQPGPLHLFWVTGVYYLWALKNKYYFVILVDNDYLKSNRFKKVIKYFDIKHIHYQKKEKGFRLISHFLSTYKKIFKKFRPRKILMHNNSFIENQCLMHIAKNQDYTIDIFNYQNGRESLNMKNDRSIVTNYEVIFFYNKYKFLRYFPKISLYLAKLKQLSRYYYYYKIIPFFLTGEVFTPSFNIFSGEANKIKNNNSYKLIKKYFVYLEVEAKTYREIEARNITEFEYSNCEIINHPLYTYGKQANNILYGKIIVKNKTLIAPSAGLIGSLGVKGLADNIITNFIADKYIDSIKILLKKFPNYSIIFKLHPMEVGDNLWINIIDKISQKIKNIEFIKKNINIEKLILESRIIVSDVSSVLWWTIFLKNKTAISLDVFNIVKGDEMFGYEPSVHYIHSLNKLKKANFFKKIKITNKKSITKFI